MRLKDVADIEFGSSMYDIYSTLNGKPSAAITVKQSYGSNASDVIKNVKALMADLEKKYFPKGNALRNQLRRFQISGCFYGKSNTLYSEAFILVAIVVFLFLGDWRSTLIPGTSSSGFTYRNICRNVGLWYYAKHDFTFCSGNGNWSSRR